MGSSIAPDMDKTIRVLLIVTGVKSSQILGQSETLGDLKHHEMEQELGIDFFEQD